MSPLHNAAGSLLPDDASQGVSRTVAASRRFLPPFDGLSESLECFGLRASSTLVRAFWPMLLARPSGRYDRCPLM